MLRDMVRRHTRTVAVCCTGSGVHQICEALVPLVIGLTVDHAVDGGPPEAILLAVAAVLVLFVVLGTAAGLAVWWLNGAVLTEAHRLRVRTTAALLADPVLGADRRPGDLVSVLTVDATATAEFLRGLVGIVSGVAGLAVTVAVLLFVDPLLCLGILLLVPAMTWGVRLLGPWLERRVTARQRSVGRAAALAAEFVTALRPLRGFGGVPEALRRYRHTVGESRDAALRSATAVSLVDGVGLLASAVALLGTVAAAAAMVSAGRITVGGFVTAVTMVSFAGDPVQRVTTGIQRVYAARAGAARLARLGAAAAPPGSTATGHRTAQAGSTATGHRTAQAGPQAHAGPSAREVAGPPRLRAAAIGAVTGIELALGRGEMLGVVAADRAVADAAADVFGGRRGPDRGEIMFGELPPGHPGLRRYVLAEPHAVTLLGRTLTEALDTGRGGDPGAALVAARATGLAEELLDASANLSGGQRQRVALARALAAVPPVLVLRDPLTAVDSVTEHDAAAGLAAYRRESGGATVVVTTSPVLLARCDRVLFLPRTGPAVLSTAARLGTNADYAAAVLR
ncbi:MULTISPECIES: ABC transporter ATP-binding protein [Catenuloplanes]|uniref:ABC transport system ATP-binding protein n=1 Tax=Catenuloplanes niger TaxID=587534 RepID=A0AAE3ZQP0_9ACTN|nr:ABC transporter ATP-binding protein [Catenuloplanes niger]MDR7323030.1 putative ABC transport system ATP-binding protein [Catenuloplanes niger]